MRIDLLSRAELSELAWLRGLRLQDIEADAEGANASIRHSVERVGDVLRLEVDHSYFTARRSKFEIHDDPADGAAASILQAVQSAVIELQTATFKSLASVNSAVINSLDEKEIVHNVLREVMNVLPHSDAGVLRLFDEESGYLVPVSHEGLSEEYTHYRLLPNESVSGEVFTTGRPAILNGRQNIIDAHRVMRPESQSFMERSQIANALLCVPVVVEGKCLGTLTTLSFSQGAAFSIFDRTVLEFLAAQIAVAYQRSLAYKNAVETSRRLEQARSDLAGKNEELDRAVELHEALLRIFSTGDELIAKLHAVSELFRLRFRFENVLGVDYQSPDWTDEGETLRHAVEVAEAPVGYFSFRNSGDAGFHRALFGTLSAFVALEFVRDMSRIDVLNARKKAHFEAMSAGIQPEGRESPFGFRPDRLCQILVTPTPRIMDPNGTVLSVYKLESDLRQAMTIPNALIFHDDKHVVMLVSASTTAALERNLDILSKTAPAMQISLGASEIYQGSGLHSHSRGLASQAAEALLRRNRPGLLRYQEMGLELLLKGQARQDVLAFAQTVLSALANDPRHRVLRETLLRYVQEGKSVTRSADSLGIHPNTLYQRLQRIEAVTGRNMADPSDFTLLSLACQIYADYQDDTASS